MLKQQFKGKPECGRFSDAGARAERYGGQV